MKFYSTLVTVLALIVSSTAMSGESHKRPIETPDGSITTITTTGEPTPQEITLADSKNVQAINAAASQGSRFVAMYLPKVRNPSLKDFDEAFRLWQIEKRQRYTEQQVIEILGACLGNKLIADFQMEWVVVKDEYGTDLAVRAKKYEVMSFPFASVVKRIEKNQYDFMVGVYHTVKASIENSETRTR
jgi:hypothetical protein